MLTSYIETLHEPIINCCVSLINYFELPISKTTVRRIFYDTFTSKGNPTLKDIKQILATFGIVCFPAELSKVELEAIEPPYLMHLGDGESNWCTVLQRKKEGIEYFDPFQGLNRIQENNLFSEDPNLVFVIQSCDNSFIDVDFELNILKEQEEEESYKSSLKVIERFLTAEECDHIIKKSEDAKLFNRSKVVANKDDDPSKYLVSKGRTSSTAHIHKAKDPVISKIFEQISKTLQYPINYLEPSQCLKYEVGQEFKMHYDSFDDGQRLYTILIYLNDDFEGGQTYFPELNFKLDIKKGMCLMFRNVDDNNIRIPQSLHSSTPITRGVKYIYTTFLWRYPFR